MSLRDLLKDRVKPEELAKVRRSFEIIGDVVIVDIPDEVYHLKDEIVKAILTKHKHVKTILRKTGEVSGEYRVARYEVIYGGETETIAREHGCRFRVDPTKAYYTVKLSGERERIARLVGEGERVLVMFAGVGPYAIVIARLSRPREVVGVEINPAAVSYFRENVRLNKVESIVRVYEGDVREVVPRLEGEFDRVLMPAPYNADDFLDIAVQKVKDGGVIHIYTFAGEEEVEEKRERILERLRDLGFEGEVLFYRECGNFAPRVNRYVFDVRVSRARG
ncbi:putative methyltransferase [Geoglobus ahangari]|uniref:tRNA (guanine(37)-N(1))-methyltransferase n=1 Tax=Geoglobus ahangari TaxID=113653 RepID=A0A0F7IFB8_9EURY|nr:class I SAM-dependent methyltransferase family protein [Geoglobus ahangari]AKG92339.1 putative methyltransferase [Geoglobus ahangari]NOY11285.1 class I SAM-dependent methyltransferase family protein [Archaeoglobi archaeon]